MQYVPLAKDLDELQLARVGSGVPLTRPNLFNHRGQRRLTERQQNQNVDEEVVELLGN
jgi:hypothetical protein